MPPERQARIKRLRRRRQAAIVTATRILGGASLILCLSSQSEASAGGRQPVVVVAAFLLLFAVVAAFLLLVAIGIMHMRTRCPRCDRLFYVAALGPIPILSNPFPRRCVHCGFAPSTRPSAEEEHVPSETG